ncbi:MAG TPA: hypothetical protein VIN07_06280 [Flavipsychrobacter sp.]
MANLYPKKLRSLKALREEKARLKAEASFAVEGQDGGDAGYADFIPAVLDAIASKGVPDKLLALAVPLVQLAGNKIEKSLLKKVAKEVLLGYAKWKGTEMAASALLRLVKRRFEKAAASEEDD